MKSLRSLVFLLVTSVIACSVDSDPPLASDLSAARRGARPEEGVIVMLVDSRADPRAFAHHVVGSHGGRIRFVFEHGTKGFSAVLPTEAVQALRRNPAVKYVEPIRWIATVDQQANAPFNLSRVDHRDLPYDDFYDYTRTGAGVTAYIVDTGIRTTHVEFGGRATIGMDATGGDGQDCNGHGTHVAGTVGGATYGIAKQVQLVGVRVIDCDPNTLDSLDQLLAGIDWIIGNHTAPAVANLSLVVIEGNVETTDQAVDDKVSELIAAGVTTVVAAGNQSKNACLVSPARVPAALTLGATLVATWEEPPGSEVWQWADIKASYSNFGTCLDLFAVGHGVKSAWWTSNTAVQNQSGTSMAAPHVAGVAALYLQGTPTATPSQVATAITTNATVGIITSAGTGSPNRLLYSIF